MRSGLSPFNVAAIALGLAFLYLPIVILVIYSFNASRLVTVWGGWSTRWYARCSTTPRCSRPPGSAAHRVPLGDAPRPCSARSPRSRWCAAAASAGGCCSRHGLRAAGDAGSHHRPGAAAAVRRGRDRARLLDHGDRAHHADHVLRHGDRAGAAARLRPQPGGGGDGSRLPAVAHLPHRDVAADRARGRRRAGCSPSRCRSTIW